MVRFEKNEASKEKQWREVKFAPWKFLFDDMCGLEEGVPWEGLYIVEK